MWFKRIATMAVLAGCGALAVPVPAQAADDGGCLAVVTTLVANPNQLEPNVVIFPAPAVDTLPTVTYVLYDVSALTGAANCVVACLLPVPGGIIANPGTPVPNVTIFPAPAIDTLPTVDFLLWDARVAGVALECIGYREPA